VIAYGTEVFVCCGFPLVNTDRTLRLRDHIEHGRLSEEARVRQYQDRITELEEEVSALRNRLAGFRHAGELDRRAAESDERIGGMKRLLTQTQRRKIVAMVVVMLKEMANKHRFAENAAAAALGTRCPLPGSVAMMYDALGDALRYGLNVKSSDIVEVIDVLEPMGDADLGAGASLAGGDGTGSQGSEPSDDDAGGAAPVQAGDVHDFWYGSK